MLCVQISCVNMSHDINENDIAQLALPYGWKRHIDQAEGQYYFTHTSTNEAYWEHPTLKKARYSDKALLSMYQFVNRRRVTSNDATSKPIECLPKATACQAGGKSM